MAIDRYRALIVDDDPVLLDGLKVALRAEPYDLHTASGATDAIALLDQVKPHVVVSDYNLADGLGTDIVARARQSLPDSCRILMTGSPSLEMAMHAINSGAITRLFLKPFQIIDLALAMREGMERAEMAQLSERLLSRAKRQSEIIERIRRTAPQLLDGTGAAPRAATGAEIADDYQPHDYASILKALRQAVRR